VQPRISSGLRAQLARRIRAQKLGNRLVQEDARAGGREAAAQLRHEHEQAEAERAFDQPVEQHEANGLAVEQGSISRPWQALHRAMAAIHGQSQCRRAIAQEVDPQDLQGGQRQQQ